MFKLLKNYRAQVVIGEYVLVFFIVVAMIAGISIYFRRALQARLLEGERYMYKETTNAITDALGMPRLTNGWYFRQGYEPYYAVRNAETTHTQDARRRLFGAFNSSTGIFRLDIDRDERRTTVSSNQLPPAFAQ